MMNLKSCKFAITACALMGTGMALSDTVYSDYYYRGESNQWDGAYFSKTKDGELVSVDWSSTDRIILTEGQTVYLDNAAIDALDNLLALKLSGKNITIYMDVAEDNDLNFGVCSFTSGTYENTKLVKTGAGKLTFKNTSCYKGSQDAYDYNVDLDIRAGTVQFQPKYMSRHNVGNLTIAEGATFYCTPGNTTTSALSLSGAGTVTGVGSEEFRITGTRATATEFSGKVTGIARLSPAGHTYFTGTVSDMWGFRPFNYIGTANRGIAGFKTFAGGSGTVSSFGKAGSVDLAWGPAYLLYLGTTGETVARTVEFRDASMASDHLAPFVLDAGASGGLTWTGAFMNSVALQQCVTLTGAKTGATSTLANKFVNSSTAAGMTVSFYLLKKGTGTWHKTEVSDDAFAGGVDVEEGTFGFDTVRDVGFVSALGTAKAVYEAKRGSPDDGLVLSPYAHILGGTGEEAVFSYLGAYPRTITTRPIGLAGNARIKAPNTAAFRWQNITGTTAGEKTLTVETVAGQTNTFADVTDGSGKVSIVHEGAGELVLTGNNGFTGDLTAKGGKVTVRNVNGAAYSYYKLTIKETVRNSMMSDYAEYDDQALWQTYGHAALDEWALYSADGTRQNKYGTHNAEATADYPELLKAYQIATVNNDLMSYYFGNNRSWAGQLVNNDHNSGNVFQGYMKITGPTTDDSTSWISVVQRLPETAATVTGYDLRLVNHVGCGKYFGNTPTAYSISASSDGMIWEEVASTNDMVNLPTTYYYWIGAQKYETRAASDPILPFSRTAMQSDYTVARVRSVGAASGASVVAEGGSVVTAGLRVNAAGNCTIDGFMLTETGTLAIEGATSTLGAIEIPNVRLENMSGLENLSSWSVSVNGVSHNRKIVYSSTDHALTITPAGFIFSVK